MPPRRVRRHVATAMAVAVMSGCASTPEPEVSDECRALLRSMDRAERQLDRATTMVEMAPALERAAEIEKRAREACVEN